MNKQFMIGRLTRDPESHKTRADKPYTKFSVAVDRKYKNKDDKKVTDFFNCVAWGSLGEYIAKYAKKGKLVYVEGENRSNLNDGKIYWSVNVDEFKFLEARNTDTNANVEPYVPDMQPVEEMEDLPF